MGVSNYLEMNDKVMIGPLICPRLSMPMMGERMGF